MTNFETLIVLYLILKSLSDGDYVLAVGFVVIGVVGLWAQSDPPSD